MEVGDNMKNFILVYFLFFISVAQCFASTVDRPSSPSDITNPVDGDFGAAGFIMENLIIHPDTGEGTYKLYTKDGKPYFLADTYFYSLAQSISINSVLISELSLYPFKPIASVGGYDLGYTLYFDSITCPDGLKEITGSATRVQSDGTVSAGNMMMLGSSVVSDIAWDDGASYMRNAVTTYDWSETDTGGTAILDSDSYLELSATTIGGGDLIEQLILPLTSVSFIDVVIKLKSSFAASGDGSILVSVSDSASTHASFETIGVSLDQNDVGGLATIVRVEPANTFTLPGINDVAQDGLLYNVRFKINLDGSWIIQKLVGGVETNIVVMGEETTSSPDFFAQQCTTLDTWTAPFLKLILKSESAADTFWSQISGIYIYWEN